MSLSKDEIEKIYKVRDKLKLTYKSSSNKTQKKRIAETLREVEEMIKAIENGEWVNPIKITQFSKNVVNEKKSEEQVEFKFQHRVEQIKLSEVNKDVEMDKMYSYLVFFEENFLSIFKLKLCKFKHEYNKIIDDVLSQFELINKFIEEYISDIEILSTLTDKEQIQRYKERIMHQKNYILIKLNDTLFEFKNFLVEILDEHKRGYHTILVNPDEKYYSLSRHRSFLEGYKMIRVIDELVNMINEFINILRIPKFKRSG